MKRKHILTQRRFIVMPNIAWTGEGAEQRLADPLIDNDVLSVGRRLARITSCALNHVALGSGSHGG
jgi:hypothetical protein